MRKAENHKGDGSYPVVTREVNTQTFIVTGETPESTKPSVVVETGVDKGLGSVVLCSALLKNRSEGQPERYIETDLNPKAGYLLKGDYAEVGQIIYGDSITSLRTLDLPFDIFINDSDHSQEYEAQEYETVAGKLSAGAVILGDNSHVTDKLLRLSRATGRHFLFWKEEPENHWYPGGGIGFSLRWNRHLIIATGRLSRETGYHADEL